MTNVVLITIDIQHCSQEPNSPLRLDAPATFDRRGDDGTEYLASDIHNIHLASLNGEFCAVRSVQQVLSEFA
jgi:hypothetical protein